MKLFQKLLVAPAALGLVAPMAANAAELNVNGISVYSASSSEVKSISEFSDVHPNDWAHQALTQLAERHGCLAANPQGSMTRYEAADLLNTCLGEVAQVNQEESRLITEFGSELSVIKGRSSELVADAGGMDHSAMGHGEHVPRTMIMGKTSFVVGGVDGVSGKEAVTFNYDTKLMAHTSFTGKDLLKTVIRTGNFNNMDPFGMMGSARLETAFNSSDGLNLHRAYYKFPVGDNFNATFGAKLRQDDLLGVWPSAYPSDSILNVLTHAGANAAYSKAMGAGAGITYSQNQLSASLLFVSDEADDASQGVLTEQGSDDLSAQLSWNGDNFTVAAIYTTSDGGNSTNTANTNDYDAYGISGVYRLENSLAFSAGMGWKTPEKEDDTNNIEDETTWSIGVVWSDFGAEGNDLGVAIGTAEGHRDDSGYDDPLAYEVYYSMAVSDNVTLTPALFTIQKDGADDVTGGLVKTTFQF